MTQDAWLLGTVQKVEMPYTFRMSFTVDLSLAVVSALDDGEEIAANEELCRRFGAKR